jgi:hypothetical protein
MACTPADTIVIERGLDAVGRGGTKPDDAWHIDRVQRRRDRSDVPGVAVYDPLRASHDPWVGGSIPTRPTWS